MSLSSSILTIPGNAICVAKSVKLQDSKSITITENGDTTILPDSDYYGIKQIIVTTNVSSAPKTASGSITIDIARGDNTFTFGTVNFTPVEYGWYFKVYDGRAMAARGLSQNSYGIGVDDSGSRPSFMSNVKVSANGNTITGALYIYTTLKNVTINWWAVGS